MKVRWSEKEKEYASSLVDGNRIDILIQSSEKRNGGVVNMMYVLKKLRKINDQNQPEGEKNTYMRLTSRLPKTSST